MDELRVFLHVLGVCVWVGGQIVMVSMVPVIQRAADDSAFKALIPKAYARVAWPAFGLIVVTGIWNIVAVDFDSVSDNYHMRFGIKFGLVLVSGVCAYIHQVAERRQIKALTGIVGLLSALGAMWLGYMMSGV